MKQGHIYEVEISFDTSNNKESNARKVTSNDESSDRSSEKLQEEKEPSAREVTSNDERQEKQDETKKQEPNKKPVVVRRSQRLRGLLKPIVQQPNISDVHIPKSSDVAENMPTHEHESVDDNANNKEGEEEMHTKAAPKAAPKTKKLALKSEGKQPIEQKDAQLSTGAALPEEKISSSGQDVQMAPQRQPLKYEQDGNEKRMYQKAFITRMSIRSFSSMVAQLNEAQTEAVRSMGFASFLKIDLKQILRKFLKCLVDSCRAWHRATK